MILEFPSSLADSGMNGMDEASNKWQIPPWLEESVEWILLQFCFRRENSGSVGYFGLFGTEHSRVLLGSQQGSV